MSDSRLVPVIAVAVLVVTAGCAGLGDGGVASAEEVRQRAVSSMADVDTYRMRMNMTVRSGGEEITMTTNGTFDREAEKARVTTTFRGQQVETYIDGTTMYVDGMMGWHRQDVSDRQPWNESTALERQRAIMENANITELGEDTLNGTPVYVVRVQPDPERLKQVVSRQGNQQVDGVSIENVTYTQYVHRDTGRLVRVDMEMTMTANGRSVDVTATMTFTDYDEPVNVTIPEEAKNSSSLAPPDSAVATP